MVVHGPVGDEQPLGDLLVGQALGEQCEDLLFAGGEPGRGGPGGRAGAARDRGHAEFLHPPPGRGGDRAGIEVVEGGEGRPELGVVRSGKDPGQGGVVGPAEPLPGGGGVLPVARDLQRVRFRQAVRLVHAGAEPP
jgi:hypothetical protein